MSHIAIRVENLSKQYRIGVARQRHDTLRDGLTERVKAFLRWNGRPGPCADLIWALKDVSFEINQGEVVGIIGRNGSGKSTLLKILSRITKPTAGRAEVSGRVGSLLEVGTGFHPELTGRENIYMNGAILGMRRGEIRRKFDEIVAFSGVERFLDTPIKRYSNGMQVRLAFAVAAHLDPEILLVDEVLAVGDAAFQRKCLGKMDDITRGGRTVVFVSHNMAAINGLCQRGAVLESGRLQFLGRQTDAVRCYLETVERGGAHGHFKSPSEFTTAWAQAARILEASVSSNGRYSATGYHIGAPLRFDVHCTADTILPRPCLDIGIDDASGQRIVTLHSDLGANPPTFDAGPGKFRFVCHPTNLALAPGAYRVKLSLEIRNQPVDVVDDAFTFRILSSDFYGNGGKLGRGVVMCEQTWELISQ